MSAILTTDLPLPVHSRGKVRDTYRLNDRELLMVATDRISAFDVVLPTPIPQKGRVLNGLTHSWLAQTSGLIRNHLAGDQSIAPELLIRQPDLAERAMRVVAAEPILFECVVRGYISGSGWKDYVHSGAIAGDRLPAGLKESDRLPEPIFTPATKALTGHDENISRAELADRAGRELAQALEQASLALYRYGSERALERGLILADTKFEFGFHHGEIILIDEVMTPDSSRFWDLERYQAGGPQPSFDKQYVRDYLERIGWNKQPPAPPLPADVVEGTSARYLEALHRLAPSLRDGPTMIYRAEVFVTLKPVVNDPAGLTIRGGLKALGFDSVKEVRAGKYLAITLDEPDEDHARSRVEDMARQLLANAVIEDFRIELNQDGGLLKTGIVVFPGTWSDRDCAHALLDVLREPVRYVDYREQDLADLNLVILPGGFSYGDHLRCGAIARFAPVMEAVADFANRGGLVLGICNGFQILQEARLLPGALLRNASCEFRCEWVHLRVEQSDSAFTLDCRPGQVLRIPISHGEGNFFADAETLGSLEANNQVVFRYCAPDGRISADANPNGSLRNIAGISNARGNVVGLMPHPERACEALLGGEDGLAVFRSAIHALSRVPA